MTDLVIFGAGAVVTLITAVAAFLVGLSEAADPAHSRPEELSELEWQLVDRERPEQTGK